MLGVQQRLCVADLAPGVGDIAGVFPLEVVQAAIEMAALYPLALLVGEDVVAPRAEGSHFRHSSQATLTQPLPPSFPGLPQDSQVFSDLFSASSISA